MDSRRKPPPTPATAARAFPSTFSSSLLDAVYRSIDESDGRRSPRRDPQGGRSSPRVAPSPSISISSADRKPRNPFPAALTIRSGIRYSTATTTSSSSDARSSSSTSSSSEQDPVPLPPRIRTTVRISDKPEIASAPPRKAAPPPPSPGGRLASLFGSIFSPSPGNPRRAANSAAAAASIWANRSPEGSPPSTHGSCLIRGRRATTKRSVRFGSVSVVSGSGDCRRIGEWKPVGGGRARAATTAATTPAEIDDDASSDASSDLFELEDLTAAGRGGGCRDELLMYGTTEIGAVARRLRLAGFGIRWRNGLEVTR